MKFSQKIIFIVTFFTIQSVNLVAQNTVAIKTYADQEISKFDNAKVIDDKDRTDGFELHIDNALKITKVYLRIRNGNLNLVSELKKPNHTVYRFKSSYVNPGSKKIEIQITQSDLPNSKTILIPIDQPKVVVAPVVKDPCDNIFKAGAPGCVFADVSNDFGFEESDFDEHDVIYVFDFNKVSTKRRFYKVVRDEKEGDRLKTSKVNFSTEVLSPKNQVFVKVSGVNRLMFDVSIEDTLFDLDSEPSALYTGMFLGDSSSLLGTLMKNFSSNVKAFGNDDLQKMIEELKCFYSMYASLKAELRKAFDPCAEFLCCSNIDFDKIKKKLININSGIVSLQSQYVLEKKKMEEHKKKIEDCKKKKTAYDKLDAEIKELEKIKESDRTPEQKKSLTDKQEQLKKLEKPCTDDEITETQNSMVELNNELSLLAAMEILQVSLPKERDLDSISNFLMQLVEQNQNLMKGATQLNGNRLEITVRINSRDSVARLVGYPGLRNYNHYKIPILRKQFVSFSSGSFITLKKNLQNKTYDWQAIPNSSNVLDSSKFRLVESGYTNPPMGFAAFGSIEWRLYRSFGVGFSGGVGLTIEGSPRMAYLAGASLFFGDLRQFGVTGGFAAMQVNRLKNNFQSLYDQQVISLSRPAIEYYKEFKVGAFVSVTYTPFKLAKRK